MVGELVVELDGQAEHTQPDVGQGQVGDEHVGHVVHVPVPGHHVDDDGVAHHTDEDDTDVEGEHQPAPGRRPQQVEGRVVDVVRQVAQHLLLQLFQL